MKEKFIFIPLLIFACLLSFQNLLFYLNLNNQIVFAILLSPFAMYFLPEGTKSSRYFYFSLFFLIFYPILKIQSLYFFGFFFFLLFLIEFLFGKLNNLPIFYLFIASPLASYLFQVFGFNIRLWLTKSAVWVLKPFFEGIQFSGNLILFGQNTYKVAPECMGMNLFSIGLLFALLIISHREKKIHKVANYIHIFLMLFVAVFLNIFSNFMRIIGIVLFDLQIDSIEHELFGLLSFFIYFLLPFYFFVHAFFRISFLNFKNISGIKRTISIFTKKVLVKNLIFSFILLLFLGILNFYRDSFRGSTLANFNDNIRIENLKKQLVSDNVLQFSNDNLLIYIKPPVNFYAADHTPLICWKGSGYNFSKEEIIQIKNIKFYYSVLKTEKNENLFTAWWYDNGNDKTISQLYWRWKMLLGEKPYYLINVTSTNREDLIKQVNLIYHKNLF